MNKLLPCAPVKLANVNATKSLDEAVAQLLDNADRLRQRGELNSAISTAERALQLAQDAKADRLIALAQLDLGNLHRYAPNTVESIHFLHAAEEHFRSSGDPLLAKALTRQGMTLGDIGDHTRALELYQEALTSIEAAGAAGDAGLAATCFGAIGVSCTQLDDFEQAEAAYQKAIPLFEQAKNHESVCFILNNLAILRARALEITNTTAPERESLANAAFAFIAEGFSRNTQTINSIMLVAALSNTRGDLLATLGRLDEALIDINQSLMAYRKIALPRGEVDALTNLGEAYLRLGQLDLALAQLHEAWRIISTHALKDHERPLQQLFAKVYERSGNPTQALTHFKLFHQLEIEHQHRDTQKKLQQMALRAEIDAAIADAQRERLRATALASQNQALDRMAHEDALTGVANRRQLDEWAETQPVCLPTDIAIALIDIDHFKQINDQYSHALGDAVLRTLGAVLRAHTRANDLAARYGGEEFVLVLTNVSAKQMSERMEKLRIAIEQQNWSALHPTLKVTASVGIAVADGTLAFKKLIESADSALYNAKRSGRNRVQMSSAMSA